MLLLLSCSEVIILWTECIALYLSVKSEKYTFVLIHDSHSSPLLSLSLSLATSLHGNETKGMIDTIYTITMTEGVRGLYRGLLPNFLKVIPAVSIGYVVYENFKVVLKVSTVK